MTDFPGSIPRPPESSGPAGFVQAMNALADAAENLDERVNALGEGALGVPASVRGEIARARAGYSVVACFVGDSVTAGMSIASDGPEKSWPALVCENLGAPIQGRLYRPHQVNASVNPDTRWSWSAGAAAVASGDNGGYHRIPVGDHIEFVGSEDCTEIRVYYGNIGPFLANRGTAQVSIDGTPHGTITPTNASGTYGVYTVTGLADTPHTVRVTGNDGSGRPIEVFGIYQGREIDGLVRHNSGVSGSYAYNWVSTTWHGTMWGAAKMLAPDIVFVSIGLNDRNNERPASEYAADLETIVDRAKEITDAVVIVIQPQSSSPAPLWREYAAEQWRVAALKNCAVVDIDRRWGGYTAASAAGLMIDPTHPGRAGQHDMGTAVLSLLGPSAAT